MTTLIEELELAAELAEGAGRKTGTLDSITEGNHFAARLRQMAAWVRELLDLVHAQKFDGGRRELIRTLTGPIPAAGTAPTERKEP